MQAQSASARMMGMVHGYLVSQSLYVAATLGIADLLAGGPRAVEELALETGAQEDPLYRLLRALAAAGVFHEDASRRFALTELGDCLRSDAAEPVGRWAANIGRPYVWAAAGDLLHSVQTGESGFRHVHGTDAWTYRASRPDESVIFDRAMADLSRRAAAGVVAAYPFSAFRRIVDVGGGSGMLLAAILAANPGVNGVLFDQPHVVAAAPTMLSMSGVLDRCEIIGGSFFETVPTGGDAYILKSVLHDWNTEDAAAILRTCRAAIPAGAKLLAVEHVIGPPNELPVSKFTDLNMLVMLGAQERTEQQFAALFAASGFTLKRIVPATSGFCIIETEPS